jgi:hypothetical protein
VFWFCCCCRGALLLLCILVLLLLLLSALLLLLLPGSAAAERAVAFLVELAFQAYPVFHHAPAVRRQERCLPEATRTVVLITWARFMGVASMESLDVTEKINRVLLTTLEMNDTA